MIEDLIRAGMNVARLNFSHGTHQEHLLRLERVRQASRALETNVGVLADLQGPKIRIGHFERDEVRLLNGADFTITTRKVPGTADLVSTDYDALCGDVQAEDPLLLDDGNIELRVVEVGEEDILCKVIVGGILKSRKGINLPRSRVSAPSLTEKDETDLIFALESGVDLVALSFVRKPEDIAHARMIMEKIGRRVPIIAKIEKREALDRFSEILETTDAIMIARGDLGVELPIHEVPIVQKEIISACNNLGVPVITATQMLESLREVPRPTRAEASDVANAIFDGTDACMLSAETASGAYPREAVRVMDAIIREAEEFRHDNIHDGYILDRDSAMEDAVGQAAGLLASQVQARAIIAFTTSGSSARRVSKWRPECPILAATPSAQTARALTVIWGVSPLVVPQARDVDSMIEAAEQAARKAEFLSPGDRFVITAGVPVGFAGTTNLIKIHQVQEA
jgi:pyruvate kinase